MTTWLLPAAFRLPLRRMRRWLGLDFDYRTAYRKADLERDYWSIVGPGSREEHEALGRGKREFLIELGLTPDWRVLDVGCGTGQLTEALLDYLSPQGLYYGTDLAAEAVAFCRRRFCRPNFHFLQNEMTRLPLAGIRFDLVYFCSVFTHLYPREISGMLAEVQRLLDRDGLAVADVFVAPTGKASKGGRGMVVLHEGRTEELFAASGLHFQCQRKWAWQPGVWRSIYRFRHAAAFLPARSATDTKT